MKVFLIRIVRLYWRIAVLGMLLVQSLGLAAEYASADENSESVPEAQIHSSNQIANLPDFPAIDQFNEVIERTLFNASRKPLAKPSGLPGGNEQTLREGWKLTGITITNDQAFALFQERKGDKRLRLEIGMPLDDTWQLDQVGKDWVSLESGDKTVRLELRQPREPLSTSSDSKKDAASPGSTPKSGSATSQRKANPTQGIVPQRGKVQEM